ncbi:MAG: class I SAM-dependent RNA methyltransferase [Alphaproteobacteria bacterium]
MVKNKTYQAELEITSLGASGDGLAYSKGKKIFVPLALSGEKVLAEISGDRARVLSISEKSPERRNPPCPYFGKCGGCTLQHLTEDAYSNFKKDIFEKTLKMQGIEYHKDIDIFATKTESRRRAELVFYNLGNSNVMFGFNQKQSHNIVGITKCLLLRPEINQILEPLKKLCSRFEVKQKGDIKVTLGSNGLDILFKLKNPPDLEALENISAFAQEYDLAAIGYTSLKEPDYMPVAVRRTPMINFSGYEVEIPQDCFLQPSQEGEAFLVSKIITEAVGSKYALDVFSGLGVFTMALAKSGVEKIKAFELDNKMVASLNRSAFKDSQSDIKGFVRDIFKDPLSEEEFSDVDLVVIDPPRAGAAAQVAVLADMWCKPKKIVMISCNPSTFARDAKKLIDGGYEVKNINCLDQFTFSSHLEVVGIFEC